MHRWLLIAEKVLLNTSTVLVAGLRENEPGMILQNMYICSAAGKFQENEPGMILQNMYICSAAGKFQENEPGTRKLVKSKQSQ